MQGLERPGRGNGRKWGEWRGAGQMAGGGGGGRAQAAEFSGEPRGGSAEGRVGGGAPESGWVGVGCK